MALMFEYKPGMDPTQPWALSPVRAQASYYWDANGVVRQAAANVIRDGHYVNGVRTALFECATTNSILSSNAFGTSWVPNQLAAASNAGFAPDGTFTASSLIPNGTTTNLHNVTQGVGITSGENVAWSCYLKPAGYSGVEFRFADSGTTNGFQVVLDLAAGTIIGTAGIGAGVLVGSVIVPLANGWFWVAAWGRVNGGIITATPFIQVYDTGAHALSETAYAGNTTSGVLAWGGQVERFAGIPSPATSLAVTAGSAANRNADVVTLSTTWPFQTQPMWGYAKFLDLGWANRADFAELMSWRDASSSPKARFRVITGSGTAGTTPSHRANWGTGTGVSAANQNAAIVAGGTNWADTVEIFWRFFATAKVEMNRSINGGAVSTATGGPTAGTPFMDFAAATGAPVFSLLNSALLGLISYKVGAGTSLVTTLAQAALA